MFNNKNSSLWQILKGIQVNGILKYLVNIYMLAIILDHDHVLMQKQQGHDLTIGPVKSDHAPGGPQLNEGELVTKWRLIDL